MSQIAAIEAALKRSGEMIGRPWPEWSRDDKGQDEAYFFHNDEPLICVVMDEEVLVALTEDEAETLIEGTSIDEDELSIHDPSYLSEIYARPVPR